MSENFVPFAPAAAMNHSSQPRRRIEVVTDAAFPTPTTPVTPAIPVPAAIPLAPAPRITPECEPKITLEREGDRITHILVQCSCGKVLTVACEY